MRGILVPTAVTEPAEIAAAAERAAIFSEAVDLLLAGAPAPAARVESCRTSPARPAQAAA
jgi:hypothetical protein